MNPIWYLMITGYIRYFLWVTLEFGGKSVFSMLYCCWNFVVEGDGIAFGRLCFDANGGVIDLIISSMAFGLVCN